LHRFENLETLIYFLDLPKQWFACTWLFGFGSRLWSSCWY